MKNETLQFKVTAQERQLIEQAALKEDTTVSRYVRACVFLSMVMDGNTEVVQLVAREIGSKPFETLRRQIIKGGSVAR